MPIASVTAALAAILIAAPWAAGQEPARPRTPTDAPLVRPVTAPVRILEEVYMTSEGAPAPARVFVLFSLAQTMGLVDQSRAADFATQLFDASLALDPNWLDNRRVFQGAAVSFLLRAGRLEGAMELFDRLDVPARLGEREFDARQKALREILPKILERKGAEGFRWAQEKITYLAATGPFPYHAAQDLIRERLARDASQAELLYTLAVTQFDKDKERQFARDEFVDLLLAFSGKVKTDLEKQGVLAAVNACLEATPPKGQRTRVEAKLESGKSVKLEGREDWLLFRLMPLLAKHDPGRVEDVITKKRYLAAAIQEGGTIQQEQALVIAGTASNKPVKLDGAAERARAWNRARSAAESARLSNMEEAFQTASEISDVAARASALAGIATALVKENRARARSVLNDAAAALDKVQVPGDRLRALPAILRAHVALQDEQQVATLYQEILEFGEELVELEAASDRAYAVPVTASFANLAEATRVVASVNPEARLAQMSRVENPEVQWHLRIALARSLLLEAQEARKCAAGAKCAN
jgi:hypothetical protein